MKNKVTNFDVSFLASMEIDKTPAPDKCLFLDGLKVENKFLDALNRLPSPFALIHNISKLSIILDEPKSNSGLTFECMSDIRGRITDLSIARPRSETKHRDTLETVLRNASDTIAFFFLWRWIRNTLDPEIDAITHSYNPRMDSITQYEGTRSCNRWIRRLTFCIWDKLDSFDPKFPDLDLDADLIFGVSTGFPSISLRLPPTGKLSTGTIRISIVKEQVAIAIVKWLGVQETKSQWAPRHRFLLTVVQALGPGSLLLKCVISASHDVKRYVYRERCQDDDLLEKSLLSKLAEDAEFSSNMDKVNDFLRCSIPECGRMITNICFPEQLLPLPDNPTYLLPA